jgi:predicted flap endonuclease-1-like 5' DNA nuclease
MWPLCTTTNFLWTILPLLIGLLTGWWAWARSNRSAGLAYSTPAPTANAIATARAATPDTVPVRMPEPAAPVAAFEAPAASTSGLGLAGAGIAGAAALTAIGIPAAIGDPDDLLMIKGIGPKLNTLLVSLGVTRFDQIAAWGAAEIDKVDDHLGNFKNRITRDSWVEQAGLLAKGMIAEFETKFGKLDSENK